MNPNLDLKQYEEVYKEIGKILVARDLSPLAAMAILSTMAEAMYQFWLNNPSVFADKQALAKILDLDGDRR